MISIHHHRITAKQLWLTLVAILFLVLVGRVVTQTVHAASSESRSGKHVLTVHDSGTEYGIFTEADTLREALKEAEIELAANDMTEPALDEELVAASYEVNVYRARPVTVIDGATQTKVMTPYYTPKQIAKQAGITLQEQDKATMRHSGDVLIGGAFEEMVIDRATAFTLIFYGKKITAYSRAATVGEMLKERDITLGKKDTLSVKSAAPLKKGMTVEIWRNGKQTVTREEAVNFPVEQIQDKNREIGYRQVKTPGVKGEKMVTYEIVMRNGKEVSRKAIKTVVTKEPVKQVEVVGAKPAFGGDLAASFAALRQCESGGNYANKNNSLYRGAYQFSYQTWANYGGYYDPADAPPAVQDKAALELYQRRGWQPWPACSASLGLR